MELEGAAPPAAVAQALRVLLATTHDVEAALARRLDVGVTDVVALQHLLGAAELGPVELGQAVGLRSAAATALVARLERAGHVRRGPHPTDGRRVVLDLTDSARAEARRALEPLITAITEVTAGFDEAERATILRFLGGVHDALTTFAALRD